MRAAYPYIPILGTKRDIDAAFTRRRLHPDSVVMFGTEIQLSSDPTDVVILSYIALPYGFTGSPGIFGRLMQGAKLYHRLFSPDNPLLGATTPLSDEVFSVDGMSLGAQIGHRAELPTGVWETGADLFLGVGAISKRNLLSEGTWGHELVFLGYLANLAEDTISPPTLRSWGQLTSSAHRSSTPVVVPLHYIPYKNFVDVSITGRKREECGTGSPNRPTKCWRA